eukprot:TRINITY_DN22385_c0_g1_i2.p2 TRINITY_DN22385_c0_g1~~TRINITY_DN22385_c0_g1_i2.p2  ORF type:complete len:110 (+),score=9.84 TRINITY_DN22385_c0_g1_i2:92-421(+)
MLRSLVGSEMCIRDRNELVLLTRIGSFFWNISLSRATGDTRPTRDEARDTTSDRSTIAVRANIEFLLLGGTPEQLDNDAESSFSTTGRVIPLPTRLIILVEGDRLSMGS